jgi:DNA anti-recombination protein RmuC
MNMNDIEMLMARARAMQTASEDLFAAAAVATAARIAQHQRDAAIAIAAHRAASAAIHAEYEERSLRMDQEFEARCAAMRTEHEARVTALRAVPAAPRALDDIHGVDDVRVYFARHH